MQLSYKAHSETLIALKQRRKRKNENLDVEPTTKRRKVFVNKNTAKLKWKLMKE